jgi:hypothetical protein
MIFPDELCPERNITEGNISPNLPSPELGDYINAILYRKLKASKSQNKDPYRRATYVGSFEVFVLVHIALRMLATIFLASQ